MKKTSLLIIIVLASITVFRVNQYPKRKTETNNIAGPTRPVWLAFAAPGDFSIRYPEGWQLNPTLFGAEPQNDEWRFVLVGDMHTNGVVDTYPFTIAQHENPDSLDCAAWLQKAEMKSVEDMLAGGGISRTDAEDFVRTRYEPIVRETFPNFVACKVPDGRGEETDRTYYTSVGDRMYSLSFPWVTGLDDRPLYTATNVGFAYEMLKSLDFRD